MSNDSFKNSAHDLNNILTSIVHSIELLKTTKPETEEFYKTIKGLEASTKRASDIVHNYLAPAGTQRKHVEIINVHTIVNEVIESFSETEKLKISVTGQTDLDLLIDGTDLYRIIQNLIKNGLEAIDSKGKINIGIELDESENKKFVNISVCDNGCGIKNKDLKNIFKSRFSTKQKDHESGFGLSIVKEKVEEYNGSVHVDSKKGETIFNLKFPLYETKQDDSKNLLLAEDDSSVSEVLADLLKNYGYNVVIAATGIEAISEINKSLFDALIIDKKMPEMDGIDCIREIRKENLEMPIILASGSDIDSLNEDIIGLNIGLIIKKPYNFPEILSALQKFSL